MSSVHCVVVWEFQSGGQWVPHTPGVTRTLERAHAKKLTRVVLSDADPALKGHHVNLRTLTQCRDMPDGGTMECHVRRSCYSVQSVGGRGARWEWARLSAPPLPAELHYEPMPMEMQCKVESAWCNVSELVSWCGWAVSLEAGAGEGVRRRAGGVARRGTAVRLVRRAHQPPYPLTRPAPAPTPPPTPASAPPPDTLHHPGRRPRIPQQHTGSSVHSLQSCVTAHSAHSAHSAQSAQSAQASREVRGGARSASPRDRKPNLARQILHNLNIFSNKQAVCQTDTRHLTEAHLSEEPRTDTECSSTTSNRRHSVDTVSTYLSHESKDSLQQGSVGELLNCSGGSDDVFESSPDEDVGDDELDVGSLGVDVGSCSWVRSVACPQWGAVCPVCMQPLAPAGGRPAPGAAAVALAACQHMLHLHCLADQLRTAVSRASHGTEAVYIECLVCGRAYTAEAGAPRPPAPAPAPALAPPVCLPPAPAPAPAGLGAQPPGSMAWRLQHAALPQCTPHTAILVTYNFQSGIQGQGHPAPGEQYYAVGFPRHSVLPDDDLGRQVLSLLRACWSRGALFCVRASRTTGREHVVAWRAPPPAPPSAPHHYLPPAAPDRLLHHVLATLHRLLDADAQLC